MYLIYFYTLTVLLFKSVDDVTYNRSEIVTFCCRCFSWNIELAAMLTFLQSSTDTEIRTEAFTRWESSTDTEIRAEAFTM